MARPKLMPAATKVTARIKKPHSSLRKRRMKRPTTGDSNMQVKMGKDARCSVISVTHQEIDPDGSQDQDHKEQVKLQERGLDKRQQPPAAEAGEGHRIHPAVHHTPVVIGENPGD